MTISIKEFCKAIGKSPEAFVGSRYNGNLYLCGTDITSLPDGLVVNGYLDLSDTAITSLPKGLVVGDWLDLRGTAIKTLPKGLVVGGSLNLEETAITSFPDDLIVGGEIYRDGKLPTANFCKFPPGYILSWRDGKYAKIDGIFCEVLRKRGNVWHVVINLATREEAVIVRDGDWFAHGKTVKEARESLIYKISNRDTTAYAGWKRSTVISKRDAIASYRAITGACEYGTRRFIESLSAVPESLTVAEVIKLTNGQYGNDTYKKFFAKRKGK